MNKKTAKVLWIITFIFLIIVIVLSLASTVLMFMDESVRYSYYWEHYSRVAHPAAGAMPCVATILLIIGLILFISSKKKPLTAIGTLCAVFLAQLLLYLSYLGIDRGPTKTMQGYYIADATSIIIFVPLILGIIYVVFSQIGREEKDSPQKVSALTTGYAKMAQELKELKNLADNGVFTQEEYEAEKAAVFKANGILVASGSILNGVYANLNSKIEISDSVFTMFYGDRVVKAGSIEKSGEKGLVLRSEDGKVLALEISGSALVTKAGVRYEKE